MTRFESPQMIEPLSQAGRLPAWPPAEIDLGPAGIQAQVDRARQLRATLISNWLRQFVNDWRSVWRRPGRAIPKTYRASKANA